MPKARVWPFTGFQNVPATPLSRVLFNGIPITQASISAITYTVKQFNEGEPAVTAAKTPLVINEVVFNSLQGNVTNPDPRWTKDGIGFNFAPTVPPAAFPEADEYWVVFVFTPTSGYPFVQICRATILPNLVGAVP
jgi:hypothetical protein